MVCKKDGASELQNLRGHLEIVYSLLDIGHSFFFFLNWKILVATGIKDGSSPAGLGVITIEFTCMAWYHLQTFKEHPFPFAWKRHFGPYSPESRRCRIPMSPFFPILIAEDEAVSRTVMVKHLTKAGYDVTAVENGRQALEAFKERFYPFIRYKAAIRQ